MPNVGPLELAIILIIALVIFGPKKLPELGRSLGRGIREFRSSVSGNETNEPLDEEKPELERPARQGSPAREDSSEPVDAEVVADNRS